jgi:hypothetical protein
MQSTLSGFGAILATLVALVEKALAPFVTDITAVGADNACFAAYNVDLSACGDALANNLTSIISTGANTVAGLLAALSAFSG